MQTTRKQYNLRWLFRLLVIPILLRKKHWGFLLAHEYSKYCLWWGKKFTSSDLFHLGATVLHTHITLCLSGVQCQYFEWSTMSTLVSWSSTQRPVNNRSQPMRHLPRSTLLPPSPLLQKSSQEHSSFEWLHDLLHFSILSYLLMSSCQHMNETISAGQSARREMAL